MLREGVSETLEPVLTLHRLASYGKLEVRENEAD